MWRWTPNRPVLPKRRITESNSCNRKGHLAKACYNEMLKKSGTVKTITMSAAPRTPAITCETTTLPTRTVKTKLATNAVTSTQHSLPLVQAQGMVQLNGRTIDNPPNPYHHCGCDYADFTEEKASGSKQCLIQAI